MIDILNNHDVTFLLRLAEALQPISNNQHDGETSSRLRYIAAAIRAHLDVPATGAPLQR